MISTLYMQNLTNEFDDEINHINLKTVASLH